MSWEKGLQKLRSPFRSVAATLRTPGPPGFGYRP